MSKKHKKAHRRGDRGMQGGQGAGGPMYQGQYGQYGQYGMGGMGADPAAGPYAAETAFAQGAGAGYGPGAGAWPGGVQAGLQAGLGAAGLDGGLLQGMPAFLRTRNSDAAGRGVDPDWSAAMSEAIDVSEALTVELLGRGHERGPSTLAHATDVLDLLGTLAIAGEWIEQAGVARLGLAARPHDEAFYRGKLHAAQYWVANELPRVELLARRVTAADDAFEAISPDWL